MEIHTLQPLLAANPFFAGMDQRYIDQLLGCATNLRFDEGQYIFREKQKADRFFVIRQGSVSLELQKQTGGVVRIATLKEGDILGVSWMFAPHVWHADARALCVTRVISMDAECVLAKCAQDSQMGFDLLKRFSTTVLSRLQQTLLLLAQDRDHGPS